MAASSSRSLEEVCESLSLIDDEDIGWVVEATTVKDGIDDLRLVLVGKLATNKPVKFNVLKDTLALVWRPGKGMAVDEVAPNLYVFRFFHEVDLKRIIEDGPWSFENNLLLLSRMKPNTTPHETPLYQAEFWVQIHKLPANFFTEKFAEMIGNVVGEFIKADRKNFEGPWKSFMRVRCKMDITKLLRRKMKIKKEGGDWIWIEFKYERLPHFCFLCGVIGHTERFCHKMFDGVNDETERPFGNWIRASNRRPAVISGNPWLVSGNQQGMETNCTWQQEVEMADTVTEVHGIHRKDFGK